MKEIFTINKKKGFTLGEVLVTLTIVGVITAITIPSLLTNIQYQQYAAGAQNAYKLGANALLMVATNNNGSVQGLGNGNSFLRNAMEGYLATRVQCDNGTGSCFPTNAQISDYSSTSGSNTLSYTDTASLLLNNGMAFSFNYNSNCSTQVAGLGATCGTLMVDTNGVNPPNTYGKDIFGFYIQSNRLVPFGFAGDINYSSLCNSSSTADGHGCAYPYIYGFPQPFSTLGGGCTADSTIGQTCIDSYGVSSFYAGTCNESFSYQVSMNGTGLTPNTKIGTGGWMQYYGGGDGADPAYSSSAELYVSQATIVANQTNGLTYCANLNVGNVAACTGPSAASTCWRLPSMDEMASLCGSVNGTACNNNSEYGANAFSNSIYVTSTGPGSSAAWFIGIGNDLQGWNSGTYDIRCVRSSS